MLPENKPAIIALMEHTIFIKHISHSTDTNNSSKRCLYYDGEQLKLSEIGQKVINEDIVVTDIGLTALIAQCEQGKKINDKALIDNTLKILRGKISQYDQNQKRQKGKQI